MSNENKSLELTDQEVKDCKMFSKKRTVRWEVIGKREMHSEGLTDQDTKTWIRKKISEDKEAWIRKQIVLGEYMSNRHYPNDLKIAEWVKGKEQELDDLLKDPTEEEKRAWDKKCEVDKEKERVKLEDDLQPKFYPTDGEITAWAEKEKKERERYLKGPNEEEQKSWASQEAARRELAAIFEEDDPKGEAREILKGAEKRRDDIEFAVRGLASSFMQIFTDEKRPLPTLDGGLSAVFLSPFVLLERLIRDGKSEDNEGVRERIKDDKK